MPVTLCSCPSTPLCPLPFEIRLHALLKAVVYGCSRAVRGGGGALRGPLLMQPDDCDKGAAGLKRPTLSEA